MNTHLALGLARLMMRRATRGDRGGRWRCLSPRREGIGRDLKTHADTDRIDYEPGFVVCGGFAFVISVGNGKYRNE